MSESLPGFDCVDCKVNTAANDEYYMVHSHVWKQTGLGPHGGMLCIGCLEERIGRKLTSADFTDAPINHGIFRLSELKNRINSVEKVNG